MPKSQEEIVQLIIDAKNLTSDELAKAAKDVENLGLKARQAEKELRDLKAKKTNIQSFVNLKEEITGLKQELAKSEVEYQKLDKALKANKNATDKERQAVKLANIELKEQRKQLASQQNAYKKLQGEMREQGVTLKNATEQQEKLTLAMKEAEKQSADYSARQQKVANQLDKRVKKEKLLQQEVAESNAQSKKRKGALNSETEATGKQTKSTDALTKVTRRLAQAYTVLLAAQKATEAIGAGVREYGALEAAITSVEKTTGIAREQLIAMTEEVQRLASDVTPTATNELLRYAEVAGQLGVNSRDDIFSLVAAADALGVSTNLAGDEAVTLLSRILQMTGEGIPSIHNLSAATVELGNNMAVTEEEIAHMTKEIVTGTSSINLGSAAAAALGATLKEAGQQAERSRTSLFRLSQVINKASKDGGDDLQTLIDITGMTADEIEKNLGERPEEVLLAFARGLNRIKDEGGVVSRSLNQLGIDGTEATSVLEVLGNKSERFAEALDLARHASEKGVAHLQEAAKAYANQDAAISRLINKFTELQVKMGEALTDETEVVLEGVNGMLDESSSAVQTLANSLGELVIGFGELSTAFDVSGILNGAGLVETTFNLLKLAANDFTLGLRTISLGFNEIYLAVQEFSGASEEELTRLRNKSAEIVAGMQQDMEDIRRAEQRLNGESSASYENLIDTVDKYGSAVSELSKEQQARVKVLIEDTQYSRELEGEYIKLVSAIIRKHREMGILAAQQEQLNIGTEKTVKLTKEEREAHNANVIALADRNAAMLEQNELILNSSNVVRDLTIKEEQLKLKIAELKRELEQKNHVDQESYEIQVKIAELQGKLTDTAEKLRVQKELETKTIHQLVLIQREQLRLEQELQTQFQAGVITLAEYNERKEQLSVKTKILNDALGENAVALERSNVAREQSTVGAKTNTSAMNENSRSIAQNTAEILSNVEAAQQWFDARRQINRESRTVYSDLNPAYQALADEIGLENLRELFRKGSEQGQTGIFGHYSAADKLDVMAQEALKRKRQAETEERKGKPVEYTQRKIVTVELILPHGGITHIDVAGQSDADALIAALTQLGDINITGVG